MRTCVQRHVGAIFHLAVGAIIAMTGCDSSSHPGLVDDDRGAIDATGGATPDATSNPDTGGGEGVSDSDRGGRPAEDVPPTGDPGSGGDEGTDTGGGDDGDGGSDDGDTGTDTADAGGPAAPAAAGDLLITEFMARSQTGSDPGEWVELHNPGEAPLDLRGCVLGDGGNDAHTIEPAEGADAIIDAGGWFVLARSDDPVDNHGLSPDYVYAGFTLTNSGDVIEITCGGGSIDRFSYENAPTLVAIGVAAQLDPEAFDAAANDDPARWCAATETYGTDGLFGTPGAANTLCPRPPATVDHCRLQGPASVTTLAGEAVVYAGRVRAEGLTDRTPGVDAEPALVAEIGVGADGSDPAAADAAWTWLAALPRDGWGVDAEDYEATYDEYRATLTAPAPGSWDVAARFSRDEGATWTYCDLDAGDGSDGSEDGYQAVNAGALDTVGDPCAPNPCDAPPADACADDTTLRQHASPGTCTLDGLEAACAYPGVEVDCAADGQICRDAACLRLPRPEAAGHVVVTEVMPKSVSGTDNGEWIELYNATDRLLDLGGCALTDGDTEEHVIGGSVPVEAGAYVVLARSDDPERNHGLVPDYVYFGFPMSNNGDTVALRCGDTAIDSVSYTAADVVTGTAIQLDGEHLDAASNDDPMWWCAATETYGTAGLFGSPGAANGLCPRPDVTVDFCALQWPLTQEAPVGGAFDAFGRVIEAGITDRSDATDEDEVLVGEAGVGPRGSDPAADAGWVWFESAANPGWGPGSPGHADALDEYQATVVAPDPAGDYDIAWRFSRDAGATWTYCDGPGDVPPGGSGDGYDPSHAGALTVTPDPCDGVICDTPGPPSCDGEGRRLSEPAAEGTCALVAGDAVCFYTPTVTDCADTGGVCREAACVELTAPAVGAVIVSEVMARATEGSDPGEWFELHNTTDAELDLGGCTVRDAGDRALLLPDPFVLGAGEFAALARSGEAADNGGFVPRLVYGSDVVLANDGGSLTLLCDGETIDAATYDADAVSLAVSWALAPESLDAASNDDAGNWCLTGPAFGDLGRRGSPGAANPPCPLPDAAIDWCRLQFPADVIVPAGAEVTFFGRLWEEGLTDRTGLTDLDDSIEAAAGFGPVGSDPATAEGWRWTPATPSAEYGPSSLSYEADNDEYVASIRPQVADVGDWSTAFRFRRNGGEWRYCDLDAGEGSDGAEDGFDPATAGSLAVTESPCTDLDCSEPPAPTCDPDGITRRFTEEAGECVVEPVDDRFEARCAFPPMETEDCSARGFLCVAGRCEPELAGPQPTLGEVIVTETMARAVSGTDRAEWVELHNLGDGTVDLFDCVLRDDGTNEHRIASSLAIEPGGFVVLARSGEPEENLGLPVNYVYSGITLSNDTDQVILECDGALVDRVAWAPGQVTLGAARQLDPRLFDADLNDGADAWCTAFSEYGTGGLLGTPGAGHEACPVPFAQPTDCRLWQPLEVAAAPGATVTAAARIGSAGVTDLTDGVDASEDVLVEVGVAPAGSDPRLRPEAWLWATAAGTEGWDATAAGAPGQDEYAASLTAPDTVGHHVIAVRVSFDGGDNWAFCDAAGGRGHDFVVDDGGRLEVVADPCEGDPCATPPAPTCDDDRTRRTRLGPGTCDATDGVRACTFDSFTTDCSVDGSTCVNGACVAGSDAPAPAIPGEMVITEWMPKSRAGAGDLGEWVELTNTTGGALNLGGCRLGDGGDASLLQGPLEVAAGGIVVIGRSGDTSQNGGVSLQAVLGDLTLNNGGDAIELSCGGTVIDAVTYNSRQVRTGVAIQLAPGTTDHRSNDSAENLCDAPATVFYGSGGHSGSPGDLNPPCQPRDTTIDWCRMQFPEAAEAFTGEEVTFFGRVFEDGITPRTDRVDVHPQIVAELGLGAAGTDPASDASWAWQAALPNPGWQADPPPPSYERNNDEYLGVVVADAAGDYDVAFRFSRDEGDTWLYCDLDRRGAGGADGAVDGYQSDDAARLTALANPCDGDPCQAIPASRCTGDGEVLEVFGAACTPDAAGPLCEYPSATTDCAESGQVCFDGACLDPADVPRPTQPGDVVVTEFMAQSQSGASDDGEWVELHNTTDGPLELAGCALRDDGSNRYDIAPSLPIGPRGYVVLAVSDDPAENHGATVDRAHGSAFRLTNGGDQIVLECDGGTIDRVDFAASWVTLGVAIQLDAAALDHTANDTVDNWCDAVDVYGNNGTQDVLGTPGGANQPCATGGDPP